MEHEQNREPTYKYKSGYTKTYIEVRKNNNNILLYY